MSQARPLDSVLHALRERAKELRCLYRVEERLQDHAAPLEQIMPGVVEALPHGWQYPGVCEARVRLGEQRFATAGFAETPWMQQATAKVQGEVVGWVEVAYLRDMPPAYEGPFLREERKLIDTIAERIGQFLLHRDLRVAFDSLSRDRAANGQGGRSSVRVVLEVLQRTDRALVRRIGRKMINHLCWGGVPGGQELLLRLAPPATGAALEQEDNRPLDLPAAEDPLSVVDEAFRLSEEHLGEAETLDWLQRWIKEDKLSFLVGALEAPQSSLNEVAAAMERYQLSGVDASELSHATRVGLCVSLATRLFSDQLDFLGTVRQHLDLEDFYDLFRRIVLFPESRGRLGGKSSGLFVAQKVAQRAVLRGALPLGVKVPRTRYLPSDALLTFVRYNELEDLHNWKYREVEQIRQEYPYIQQTFRDSRFPPEMVTGLSRALDELGDGPLIVRSSSLLEDRSGAVFSGKYKSLFLANRGPKARRLGALLGAVAEVYSSVFSPDPIEYRAERNMLDFREEMGILLQQVVGVQAGRYFLPAFAGVAFSNNELRWSPRIRREDGLLRLVPGLGTRAVDRISDDFPVLVSPGQPGLRVNVGPEEVMRYSPRWVDVIDLERGAFETVSARDLLRSCGAQLPGIRQLVSVFDGQRLRRALGPSIDFARDELVFTFEGLLGGSPFLAQMRALMDLLRDQLGGPVDLEFASDGEDLYLLQCRPQSYRPDQAPAAIPRDLPRDRVVFTANRYVSNAAVPELSHLVYVDPEAYAQLGSTEQLRRVGRAVGRLNHLLPKRGFALIGPGRWGSRGDPRLGVSVGYSDINGCALLVEVARRKGNYVPELSFGTHFFQDLVEAGIAYLPLYPDDAGVVFREPFFRCSESILPQLLPDFADLERVLRVIDLPAVSEGRVLKVLLNGELDEAVALLAEPSRGSASETFEPRPLPVGSDEHWRWRLRMAESLSAALDPERFGVQALYVFGSTKNASAGPGSDIDLLLHVGDDPERQAALQVWLDGWSRCLAEMNYLRTGYRSAGLLDAHFVTDQDIARRTSYASKIGAVTDAARPLPLGTGERRPTGS